MGWIKVYDRALDEIGQNHLSLILNKPNWHITREICLQGSKSFVASMHNTCRHEFQKYNTNVRFIGFQPIRACIIDQLGNLDTPSN
jgi:hypothetical protein